MKLSHIAICITSIKQHLNLVLSRISPYQSLGLEEDHFLIHCNKLITDSTNSCPLLVKLYSTLGGISLYARLSKMPPFSSSFNRIAKVLLLNPFKVFLNLIYLTGFVEQHNGIRISRVPRFVINFLNLAVSFIRVSAS